MRCSFVADVKNLQWIEYIGVELFCGQSPKLFGTTRSNSTIRGDFHGSSTVSADCFIVSGRLGDWFSDRAAYNDIYVTWPCRKFDGVRATSRQEAVVFAGPEPSPGFPAGPAAMNVPISARSVGPVGQWVEARRSWWIRGRWSAGEQT